METVSTAKESAQRLEDYVSRHGCGSMACDVCADLDSCLVTNLPVKPRAVPVAPRLPVASPGSTLERSAALARAQAEVFAGELSVY
jgi:hypothetical protein